MGWPWPSALGCLVSKSITNSGSDPTVKVSQEVLSTNFNRGHLLEMRLVFTTWFGPLSAKYQARAVADGPRDRREPGDADDGARADVGGGLPCHLDGDGSDRAPPARD